jgi:hypothetical protein
MKNSFENSGADSVIRAKTGIEVNSVVFGGAASRE